MCILCGLPKCGKKSLRCLTCLRYLGNMYSDVCKICGDCKKGKTSIKNRPFSINESLGKYEIDLEGIAEIESKPVGMCTICLEDIIFCDKFTLKCDHRYHSDCILAWFKRSDSCPLYRTKII